MRSFLPALVLCAASALALAQPSPVAPDPGPRIPDGFTPIFNGVDLTGWHVSRTNHHGTANHAANGATDGMIAIQMHYSDEKTPRWVDAGFWRWRVIAVKELP